MHTVCFSKLLSGFTGFLMAGKKHGTPVTGQKSHLKFHLKIDQISKLFSLLSSAKLKKGFQDSDYNPHSYFHNFTIFLKVHNISTPY